MVMPMTDIFTYLKDYREETPGWIGKYLRGEQISFKDIMSSRVAYYPGYYQRCNCDGTLIKVGNKSHSVHSFLYVDLIKREELETQIAKEDSFRGYHLVGQIEWQESDIMPSGQHQIFKPIQNNQETPYCFSIIMERNEDKDDAWGAEHFAVNFLYGISIDIYYWLFKKEYLKAPWLFLLNERYRRGTFERYIKSRYGYPQFVLFDELYDRENNIWKGYEKVENVPSVFNESMRSLYLYSYNAVECNVK
jgi:DNA-directed RNA polymerase delta subunit